MKKLSISSALLAIAVIVISAFSTKPGQIPTYGRLENGKLIPLDPFNYHCEGDENICVYDQNEDPIESPEFVGTYVQN